MNHEQRRSPFRVGWSAVLVSLLLLAFAAEAQISYSNLRGTVMDASGAKVQGATVMLVEPSTGLEVKQAATDADGNYELPALKPGTYRLKVEKKDFKSFVVESIVLDAGQTRRVDATLAVGSLVEIVTVQAGAAVIETESGTISDVLSAKTLGNSPMGDNFPDPHAYLATLPGIQSDGSGYGLKIHGQDFTQQTESIDGTPSDRVGTNIDLMSFVDELSVVTSNAPADSSRPTIFNATTKRGSNAWHGSAYDKMINNSINATPHLGPGITSNDKLILHEAQAEISGPIWKDKTFFYASYWTERINQDSPQFATVPTAAMKNGDFTGFPAIRDPRTGQTFASENCPSNPTGPGCNSIPASLISPVSAALQKLFPQPNAPGATGPGGYSANNFQWIHPYPDDTFKLNYLPVVRVDHNLTKKNSLFVKWLPRSSPYVLPQSLPKPFFRTIQWNTWELNAADTHIFSSTLTNNFRFAAVRESYLQGVTIDGNTPVNGGAIISQAGLQGINPGNFNLAGFTNISFGSSGLLGAGVTGMGESAGGLRRRKMDFVYGDDVTWIKGKHVLKFGADLLTFSQLSGVVPDYGRLGFNGFASLNSYADFLLGIPHSSSRRNPLVNRTDVADELGIYATDTFKVTPRLTLSYGLRWDYYTTEHYKDGLEYTFHPLPFDQATGGGYVVIPASKASLVSPLYPSVQNGGNINVVQTNGSVVPAAYPYNFRPRVSLAYQLGNHTVVRGGYGQYTERIDVYYTNNLVSGPGPFDHLRENYTNCFYNFANNACNPGATSGTPLFSFPNPFPNVPPNPYSSSQYVDAWPKRWRNGVIHQFNFGLEREVGKNGVRATYIGSRNRNFNYNYNGNFEAAHPGPFNAALLPYSTFSGVQLFAHDGSSNYDAMELEAKRREGWFTFDASYTWSNSESNSPLGDFPFLEENLYVPHRRWAVDPTVRRSFFDVTTVWEVPFGKGRKYWSDAPKVLDAVLGGWTIETVSRMGSPTYDTPYIGSSPWDIANDGYGASLPDLIPGQSPNLPASQQTQGRYWNTAVVHGEVDGSGNPVLDPSGSQIMVYDHTGAFMIPGAPVDDPLCLNYSCRNVVSFDPSDPNHTPAFQTGIGPGRYGRACLNCLRMQNLFTHHLNFSKTFPINERVHLKLSASILNLFNHPHFYDPTTDITSYNLLGSGNQANYGQLTYAYGSDLDFFSDKSGYRKTEVGITVSF